MNNDLKPDQSPCHCVSGIDYCGDVHIHTESGVVKCESQAGPELDAWIAEHVMGWNLWGDRWFDSDKETCWRTDAPYFRGDWEYWNPSAPDGIASAMEVAGKLESLGCRWNFSSCNPVLSKLIRKPWVHFYRYKEGRVDLQGMAEADTLPLAICLAAKKAKEAT